MASNPPPSGASSTGRTQDDPAGETLRAEEDRIARALQGAYVGTENWRDSTALQPALEQLREFAQRNPARASALWERVVPGDPDPPAFLNKDRSAAWTGSIGQALERSATFDRATGPSPEASAEPSAPAPARASAESAAQPAAAGTSGSAPRPEESMREVFAQKLARRYHVIESGYYSRDQKMDLVFRDDEKFIRTRREDTATISDMLDLAQSKGWQAINVSGSREFRAQVWLQASERGLQVQDYQPTPLDLALLEERTKGISRRERSEPSEPTERAEPVQGRPQAERTVADQAANKAPDKDVSKDAPTPGATERPGAPVTFSEAELDKMRMLRERLERDGASEVTMARVMKATEERFARERYYIGVLIDHGRAPYPNANDGRTTAYVTLETTMGMRTEWGEDLPRAIQAAGVQRGDSITLRMVGRESVAVGVPTKDASGQVVGSETRMVERNQWEVTAINRLNEQQRAEANKRAQASVRSELVGVVPPARAAAERSDELARNAQAMRVHHGERTR